MDFDENRGTGRTLKQMLAAPQGALFVWCNSHLEYPRNLARDNGREDLKIISIERLRNDSLLGIELRGLVIDHACKIDTETRMHIQHLQLRVNRNK